ncbi:dTDP-4-dehydrorhamnose reductase [Flavivirga amylovorans]|uniref:dTDP-4-dehydrorhamnose reductase n=1 Tax=Flavivirga amylovorans TaxID=870486 RepID=A0ABT8X5N7_9FLAO|nr:dTDP-4-dehydrorhamnose reductase [Flavivirga amylovorans]MDO5989267.1 dTDP-4-dehydrorhamnose reductase [Flavivirga amylovorans]
MIKVLVTGANGQLGKCIQDVAKEHNGLSFVFTDYLELDICNEKAVNDFFQANEPLHYCINCAAYTAVDKAEEEKEKAYKINVLGAKHLALACKMYNTTLIQVSTDFVFNGLSSKPYIEKDEADPISVYGETKLQGELAIINILKEHFIIRTSWLYSEHGNNFMKTMLYLAETRNKLSIINDQIGTPTYAKDLALVILNLISNKSNYFGLYHYSNEGMASWYDFAKAIFEITKTTIETHPVSTSEYFTPAKRPAYSVMDKSKIKSVLEIEISNWRDSLINCLKLI